MPRRAQDGELVVVLADRQDARAGLVQDLRDQQSELAVAEHQAVARPGRTCTCSRISNAAASGSTNTAVVVVDPVGHGVQVGDRHRDALGKGAVGAEDAHHAPRRAVATQAAPARLALRRRRS